MLSRIFGSPHYDGKALTNFASCGTKLAGGGAILCTPATTTL